MEYAIETLEIELEHCKSGYKDSTDSNLKSIYSQQVLEIVRALKLLRLNPQ